jgi:hypothetical protein
VPGSESGAEGAVRHRAGIRRAAPRLGWQRHDGPLGTLSRARRLG